MVRIGSGPNNEIVLPVLGPTISHTLVRIDSLATVCVTGDMSGELVSESGVKNFGELTRSNRLVKNAVGYEIGLAQGEMLRVGVQGDLINIFVRYVPEAPKPLVAPLLDLSASEVTGVILATVVSLIFGLYMMIYAPKKLDEEALLEEPLRKAVVTFKPPTPTPKEVVEPKTEPVPKEKKIVKVVDKKKEPQAPSAAIQTKEDPGKAAEARPNPNKSPKKTLTSTRQGGAIDTGKKGASPTSETVDVSKTGLLGVFGSRGTQKKLDKAYTGSGELQGMADSATGFAGDTETRAGDNLGSKIKDTGPGGKGTATVGIAGVGTSGKGGTGNFGYGTGGLGKKGRIEVQVGGQEAEFVGAIDREAIRRVILANKKVIRTCYEMALARNPDLYGKLVIQWDIEERGRVTNAQIVSNTLGNNTVATCLVQRLQTWRFPDPPPDQIGRVTYPFVFTSQ
jgi:outer membrane biosynthesis protein TonB